MSGDNGTIHIFVLNDSQPDAIVKNGTKFFGKGKYSFAKFRIACKSASTIVNEKLIVIGADLKMRIAKMDRSATGVELVSDEEPNLKALI